MRLKEYAAGVVEMTASAFERGQSTQTYLSAAGTALVALVPAIGLTISLNWPWSYFLSLAVGGWVVLTLFVIAPFRLWARERKRVEAFEDAAKPRLKVSLTCVKEPKGADGPVLREWRLLIENTSTTLLTNCTVRKKSLVNAQGLQSDSLGACFVLSKERWAQSGHHERFDLHPRTEEYVSIVCWDERQSSDMPTMMYATPGVRNAIPHGRWPHVLVVQISADNIPSPIERSYRIDIEGERLSMKEL